MITGSDFIPFIRMSELALVVGSGGFDFFTQNPKTICSKERTKKKPVPTISSATGYPVISNSGKRTKTIYINYAFQLAHYSLTFQFQMYARHKIHETITNVLLTDGPIKRAFLS